MKIMRLAFKMIAIPSVLIVTLIQWIGVFIISFSAVIFNLFAGLCFMLSVVCYLMRVSTGAESLKMLIMAFIIFIIPHIGEWIVIRIAAINYRLRNFIRS